MANGSYHSVQSFLKISLWIHFSFKNQIDFCNGGVMVYGLKVDFYLIFLVLNINNLQCFSIAYITIAFRPHKKVEDHRNAIAWEWVGFNEQNSLLTKIFLNFVVSTILRSTNSYSRTTSHIAGRTWLNP